MDHVGTREKAFLPTGGWCPGFGDSRELMSSLGPFSGTNIQGVAMTLIPVHCVYCESDQVVKRGMTRNGKQRYPCQNEECAHGSFLAVVQRVDEAEGDEMWSYVGHKDEQRWLWHAIDHATGVVLAYVLGRRKDEVFLALKQLLEPFGITRYDTDHLGAYQRHPEPDAHCPGKRYTQPIERKHLTLRTRIKRLARKTICFSQSVQMHDIVIGLFVNRYEFARPV